MPPPLVTRHSPDGEHDPAEGALAEPHCRLVKITPWHIGFLYLNYNRCPHRGLSKSGVQSGASKSRSATRTA